MTTRMKSIVITLAILALVGAAAYAQVTHGVTLTIEPFAILGIDGGGRADTVGATINLSIDGSGTTEPGATLDGATATSAADAITLQYTVVTDAGTPAAITVAALDGISPGILLRVSAAGVAGNEGTPATDVSIINDATGAPLAAQNLITAITSCATGTAGTDGAALEFEAEISDSTALNLTGANTAATLQYTITAL